MPYTTDFTKGQNQYDLSRAMLINAASPIRGASGATALGKVIQAYFAQKGMNKGEATMQGAEQAKINQNQSDMANILTAYNGFDPREQSMSGGNMTPQKDTDALVQAMIGSSNPDYQKLGLAQAITTPKPVKGTSLMQNLEAAGYVKGTPEYAAKMEELMGKSGVNVNVGTGFKMPTGHMENPNFDPSKPVSELNTPVMPIPGSKTARDYNKPTATQSTAANYASRMVQDEKTLTGLVERGFDPTQLTEHAADKAGALGNFWKSTEGQQYRQAQEDWVRAKLRKESGAVIADEEMEREIRVYFPQPGDSAEVIRQKSIQRMIAANGMIKEADLAYEGDLYEIPEPDFGATVVNSQAEYDALPSGAVFIEDGKRYKKP